MASGPEAKVKAAVKKWLDERGCWYFMPVPHGRGRNGIPDFVACVPWLNGRMLAIETKAPGKLSNTTAHQRREIKAINLAGGVALVIDDVRMLDELLMVWLANTTEEKGDAGERAN